MTDLARRLGLRDAVILGLGSMLGAGVFVVLSPASAAAGSGLLWGLLVAGALAYANATSSARLAVVHPRAGGAYVYGTRQLGDLWGYLAGWAVVVGGVSGSAVMALTVGTYLWPAATVPVAALSVIALTALSYRGVHRSALVTRAVVAVVVIALLALVVVMWAAPPSRDDAAATDSPGSVTGVLQATGFFVFAVAGWARIATSGATMRDRSRTVRWTLPTALGIVVLLYALVGASLLYTVGADWIAGRSAPLAEAAEISGWPWFGPVLRVVAGVAALAAMLGLLPDISRTTQVMARDRHLPSPLAVVHERHGVPHRAILVVGVVVTALVVTTDLRGAIGFSVFSVLVYHALANASAWTLRSSVRSRIVPSLGLVGCLVVAAMLPLESVVAGVVVIAAGIGVWWLGRAVRKETQRQSLGAGDT